MSAKKYSKLVIVLTVLLVVLSAVVAFAEGEDFVGKPVPSIKLKDLDGNEKDISEYKGKTVLINFWGLRCGSCIEEMPHLNGLHDKYKDKGLVILGINADGIDGDFIKGPKGVVNLPVSLKYTLIQDAEMKHIDTFKMEAAPLNILIDTEGVVQFYHSGYEPGDETKLDEKIGSVIK